MDPAPKHGCILCQRSEETKTTGNLSTKDDVTAHQNCLLYSSGIFCTSTPEFDELFGFSVEDVKKEVKRGRKLWCYRCKKRGATSGCEVRRCKRSFHYPCAVEEGAKIVESEEKEQYTLFCLQHSIAQNGDSANTSTSLQPANGSSEARPSKELCPACKKSEGNIRLDSLDKSIFMLYCDKHAPPSLKTKSSGKASDVQLSPSCSSSSSRTTLGSFKRRLSFNDQKKEKSSSKKKHKSWNRIQFSGSSDSDVESLIPPLESDFDESVSFLSQPQPAEPQLNSVASEKAPGSPAGSEVEVETMDVDKDESKTMIDSDAESESLLLPLPDRNPLQPNGEVSTQSVSAEPSVSDLVEKEVQTIKRELEDFIPVHLPEKNSGEPSPLELSLAEPPLSQGSSTPHSAPHSPPESPPHTSSTFELALCEPVCVTFHCSPSFSHKSTTSDPIEAPSSPPPSPHSPPSDPTPSIDSTRFWRNCNTARCTQAIFSEFIKEMNEISIRIQSDQASQEDYDCALSVMRASGRFEAFLAKQQEELQRKQEELQKVAAAMEDVVSALRK